MGMWFYIVILMLHVISVCFITAGLYTILRHVYIYDHLSSYLSEVSNNSLQQDKENIPTIDSHEKFINWKSTLVINTCITNPINLFKDKKIINSRWWIWDYKKFLINVESDV